MLQIPLNLSNPIQMFLNCCLIHLITGKYSVHYHIPQKISSHNPQGNPYLHDP